MPENSVGNGLHFTDMSIKDEIFSTLIHVKFFQSTRWQYAILQTIETDLIFGFATH